MGRVKYPLSMAALFLTCLLPACGGGGGASVPTAGAPVPSSGFGTVSLTVGGPNATVNSSTRRKPQFVGAAVQSIQGSVSSGPKQIAANSVLCPQTPAPAAPCELRVNNVPAGSFMFDIYAVDANQAVLSHVQVPITVTGGTTTIVHGTLNGSVASANLVLLQPLIMNGTASTAQLIVNAYDWDKELILTPGNYDNGPINLKITPVDPALASTISLSATSVNGPSDKITVSYDGKSYESLNVAVTPQMLGPNGAYATVLIAPQLPTTMYAIPSGLNAIGAPVIATDGSVWAPADTSMVRITPSGQVSEFCVNPGSPQIAPGANGRIFFGLSLNYQPAPGANPCAATTQGLRSIDASGTVTQTPFPQWTNYRNISGPVLAPDGTLWVSVEQQGPPSTNSLVHFDSAGTLLGSVQLSYSGNTFGLGTIAADGSFWYPWAQNIVRCTTSGTCTAGTAVFGQPYIDGITTGTNNDMIVTANNAIYDVDLNQNVLNTISIPIGGNTCTTYAIARGGYWCGWASMGSGHLLLMRYNTTTRGYSYVQLNALDSQGTQAPFGLMAAPDGRIWFVHDTSVGVAGPIQ